MARNFSTRTDTDKTDLAKYPDGRLKDGLTDGTEANESVLGDMYQVFLKAIRDAGITPNGLPDNETNGWQMFDACFGTTKVPITTFYNGASSIENQGKKVLKCWKENGGRTVRIEGNISIVGAAYADKIFTLPVGFNLPNDFSLYAVGISDNQLDSRILFNSSLQEFGLYGDTTAIAYINWSIPID